MIDFTPKSTDDMVFSNPTSKTTIRNILNGKLPFPKNGVSGLLFYGVYGSGKTIYADIFCNELEFIRGGPLGKPFFQKIDYGKETNFIKTIQSYETSCNCARFTYSNLVFYI